MTDTPPDEDLLAIVVLVNRRHVARAVVCLVAFCLSLFVVRFYVRNYDPRFGWTKLISFGSEFAPIALPRLQRTTHYVDASEGGHWGYDGQFYAQLAIDPSLRDPAFDQAIDLPSYRARRVGVPAAAFIAGLGKPRRILQVYALTNLLFWFVLLGTLCWLLRPTRVRRLLCLGAAALAYGAIASMERSLIDLPAAALAVAAVVVGSWGGCALLAGALFTRETSLLAVAGLLDPRRPWRHGGWKQPAAILALAGVPFGAWLLYVNHRFGHLGHPAGMGNFAFPLQSMCLRAAEAVRHCAEVGLGRKFDPAWPLGWLYADRDFFDLEILVSIFAQGLYLVLRRDAGSAFWRMGVCYLALGTVLGPAVWAETGAAARVLLPMTLCFYLRLARERAAWFWPFFLLGSLPVPYGIHELWTWS